MKKLIPLYARKHIKIKQSGQYNIHHCSITDGPYDGIFVCFKKIKYFLHGFIIDNVCCLSTENCLKRAFFMGDLVV